jgi:hypothetical protein
MRNAAKRFILPVSLALVLALALILGGCATNFSLSKYGLSKIRIKDSGLIYGYMGLMAGAFSVDEIKIFGKTDSGRTLYGTAMLDKSGFFYMANLPPGKYCLAEIHFTISVGTTTMMVDTKKVEEYGVPLNAGDITYLGTFFIKNLKNNRYLLTQEARPTELETLDTLLKKAADTPWAELVQKKFDSL